jgi:hypothetical protein
LIIYNVTTKVVHSCAAQWLDWMKKVHVPEVLGTGYFNDAKILHLFENDDHEGLTYAVQYSTSSYEQYLKYLEEYAPLLRNKSNELWKDQVISFRSVMKIVE